MAMTFSPSRPPRIIISSHLVSIASKSGTKDIRGAREKRGNRSEEEGCLAETAGLSLGFEQAEDVVDLDCCGIVVSLCSLPFSFRIGSRFALAMFVS